VRVFHQLEELQPGSRPVCVAIGMFDGVHLGHQQVIRQAVSDAARAEGLAVVITFDRHPASILAPQRAPRLIQSLDRKLRVIETLGPDAVWLIRFDRAFSEQEGEAFTRALHRAWPGLRSLHVGGAFSFGRGRSGNVALLKRLGRELGFTVHPVAAVALGGEVISSTRIREAIRHGRFDAVQQMLGREYLLEGPVVAGDRLGRTLGFPTANLDVSGLVLPPAGVYAVHALVGGQAHRAVLNIGHRPTLRSPEPALRVEAHLLGFQGDLYGQRLGVRFVARLRDEARFDSLEALRRQIALDAARAEALMGGSAAPGAPAP